MNQNEIEQSEKIAFMGIYTDPDFSYTFQYKEALDLLYQSDKPIDTIALPMMFLMRHYLELMLKYNIKYFSKFSESKSMIKKLNNEHRLEPLANSFQEHWNLVVKKYNLQIDDKEYMKNFKILINIINKLDSSSMSFRYAYDKNENKHFKYDKTIDIYSIKKLLEEVLPLLVYSTDVFYQQVGQYIEQEEEMMRE